MLHHLLNRILYKRSNTLDTFYVLGWYWKSSGLPFSYSVEEQAKFKLPAHVAREVYYEVELIIKGTQRDEALQFAQHCCMNLMRVRPLPECLAQSDETWVLQSQLA